MADGYDLAKRGRRIHAARMHRSILEGAPLSQHTLAVRMTTELGRAEQLERRIEVTQTDVSRWEVGRKDILAMEGYALARVLGVPAGWLLFGEASIDVPATLTTILLGGRRSVGRPARETLAALDAQKKRRA